MRLDDNISGLLRARCKLFNFTQSGQVDGSVVLCRLCVQDAWIGLDDDGKKED